MQENRAFDHYFGTMAGVRGFNDANLQMNNGIPVWDQLTTPDLTKDSKYVTPWYLNYLGGNWPEATQCMVAGSNGWFNNHAAWNHGTNDHWAMDNTPYSIGFYKRQDLPTHWSLAENWLIADMYQESVVAATSPNRVAWASGSINVPGGPQSSNEGGNPYIDNNRTPGCEKGGINCYPLKWKTAAEYYEDAGVSWQVYQDADNFDDNPLAWFRQFQDAKRGSNLYNKGMKRLSLDTFYKQAAKGSLPAVSYIIGPTQLSEHPPMSPHDGAWLQNKIANAVIKSPIYPKTALIVSYDETGGWFDHVDPYRSPDGTAGEWLDDPYGQVGHTFAGPGFRVPFYIISPWTRNGGVYTEHSDHNSQLLFIEKWQAAKGHNVTTDEMVYWRRQNMGDLVSAFDFANPNYSIPSLPTVTKPHKGKNGKYDGASHCQSLFSRQRPPVPYKGNGVIGDMGSVVEHGFKPTRGKLTEGRYLVPEMNGYGLSSSCSLSNQVCAATSTTNHDSLTQRWVVHATQLGGNEFTLTTVDKRYICANASVCSTGSSAVKFQIDFTPSQGYSFKVNDTGKYLLASKTGDLSFSGALDYWKVYSVNY
ncbi:Non-hemolytic phospholipase C [Tolypocladium paradoxum]|uniref:Non-hemolytic phospholipase C n=1 Tax=Tolypocladium paradoxum TaxID=94208 RepID=A0A2S4KY05_9HYPO|nr:Non-hemolytic phospholipase C [Tolypocladium paradoxum]